MRLDPGARLELALHRVALALQITVDPTGAIRAGLRIALDGREVRFALPELIGRGVAADVAVCDPPRAGFHPKALAALATLGPARIVYVSCNPATLARDVGELTRAGYRLEWVQPVDMFPHTPHIEVVAHLVR